MATKPTNSARLFALTSSSACSVTMTQDGKAHTWQALPDGGGQTTFIIPAGAVVELSDEKALLSPLPFNVALGAGSGSVGGSITAEMQKMLPLTAAENNLALESLSWAGLCAAANTKWLREALLNSIVGDTAYINLASCTSSIADSPAYITNIQPLLKGRDRRLMLGEGVNGLKRYILKMDRGWYGTRFRMCCRNADVDFVLIFNALGAHSFQHMEEQESYIQAKSLTLIFPSGTNDGNLSKIGSIITYSTSFSEDKLACPIRFIMPALIAGADFRLCLNYSGSLHYDTQITHLNITACLPSYVSSFSFYKSNFNSVENLIYLMDNLGTPASGNMPQLSFGLAEDLVDMSGDEPLYTNADLQAAVEKLRQKGWEDVPSPIHIS